MNNTENFIDIKLNYKDEKGYFDLSFTKNGDLKMDESFDTTLNCSLLTDGRADKSEINQVEKQRGTIVDLFTDRRNGSKLWLLEQARVDLDSKNKAIDYAKNALQFLIDEGFCKDVSVSARLQEKGIVLNIAIERLNGVFDKYKYNAWENSIYKV